MREAQAQVVKEAQVELVAMAVAMVALAAPVGMAERAATVVMAEQAALAVMARDNPPFSAVGNNRSPPPRTGTLSRRGNMCSPCSRYWFLGM
jgi:hypothetical protein